MHSVDEGGFCYSLGSHVAENIKSGNLDSYPDNFKSEIVKKLVRIKGELGDFVLFDDRGFHGPHQPTKKSRTVFLFDYYKLEAFNGKTKTPIPLLVNEIGALSKRQLEVLGIGLDPMIPYNSYHTRSFNRSIFFTPLTRISAALFNYNKYKNKIRKFLKR